MRCRGYPLLHGFVLGSGFVSSLTPQSTIPKKKKSQNTKSRQRLRSSSSSAFVVPATRRSTLGDRSFCAADTRAWNSLPPTVTAASTLSSFRRHLKSHLFTKSFPSWRWLLLADVIRCDCSFFLTLRHFNQFFFTLHLHYITIPPQHLYDIAPSAACE